MAEDFDFNSTVNGLMVQLQGGVVPLGTNSATDQRYITPSQGTTYVAKTVDDKRGFWDALGDVAASSGATTLLNRYVNGKITKEAINDGVPLYTTYGNPNDQAGGKLLSDVAQENAKRSNTILWVGGGAAVLLAIFLIARK